MARQVLFNIHVSAHAARYPITQTCYEKKLSDQWSVIEGRANNNGLETKNIPREFLDSFCFTQTVREWSGAALTMNALLRGSSSSSMHCRPQSCGSNVKHLPLQVSYHSRFLVVPHAAGQQQQNPQPVSNYKDMMQQYRSLVPAQPAEQQNARRGASTNFKSKPTKVTPRSKPTQHSGASPVDLRETTAAAAAAAARTVKSAKTKTGGSSAASSAQVSRRSNAQLPDEGSQLSSSQKRGDNSSSNSNKASFQHKDGAGSRNKPPAIPSAWRLSSNGKGFGGEAASTTGAPSAAETSGRGSPHSRVVKVFRFGLTAAAVSKAIEACNWQGRVVSVDNIKQADLLLAIKCTPGGEHLKLGQVRCSCCLS